MFDWHYLSIQNWFKIFLKKQKLIKMEVKPLSYFLAILICFALISGCLGRQICSFDLPGQNCVPGNPDSCTSICKSSAGAFDFAGGICYTDTHDQKKYCTCSYFC
ncbi:hypothetical protein ABFS82_02G044900 [Erythranthe guttata]